MKKAAEINVDELARIPKTPFSVIPAETGIQEYQELLDPGFRRGDGLGTFCQSVNVETLGFRSFPLTWNPFCSMILLKLKGPILGGPFFCFSVGSKGEP